MMYATITVLILFVTYCIWHYSTYNALINRSFATAQSWSNVEVELKRRLDLIVNLVEVTKGYAKHEADTLTQTVAARIGSMNLHDPMAAKDTQPLVKETLSGIFALAESYPDIKADEQFLSLQKELTNTEDRVAMARRVYNQNVSFQNNACQNFPGFLIAWVHEFHEAVFFDIPDDEANRPVVLSFSDENKNKQGT
jgi:LemA protein